MSTPCKITGGLRYWSAEDLMRRRHAVERCVHTVQSTLLGINSAWQFMQIEAPMLIPASYISPSYDDSDVFHVAARAGGEELRLRPETTKGSYEYALQVLQSGIRAPLCIWQVGKSFRRELNDGARPSQLRYNEFTQLEFQCIYAEGTKADYKAAVLPLLEDTIAQITSRVSQVVPSDRLPEYSEQTTDIEVSRPEKNDWKEMASISIRKDFPDTKYKVLEIAIGIDRLVDV